MTAEVVDKFSVTRDATMPTLALALDAAFVESQFNRKLRDFLGLDGQLRLRRIEVTRHKPGRRCVVEYRVEVRRPKAVVEHTTLIGKVRARRFGKSGYRTLSALWAAGFWAGATDGISVPEPIGTIGKLQMWLQRKVPGTVATELLRTSDAERLASRIAEAAVKVHNCRLRFDATHDMAKEIRILQERLPQIHQRRPGLKRRIDRVLQDSAEVAASVTEPRIRPIHRDFYADQVMVDDDRLYLLDFDLCCMGDPAVDIGNFAAHITEQSIREYGDRSVLKPVEDALVNRFNDLTSSAHRDSVNAYRLLTLVRHIYLSTTIPERGSITEIILERCEAELTQWWRESLAR